jgi:hypothetical protein
MQINITALRYKPSERRYFVELMELHEANYLRLRCLLPVIDELGESAISTISSGLDMHFCLLERCKFTLTFSLSYVFKPCSPPAEIGMQLTSDGSYRAPDLQIRMYQDAQLAEVISGVLHKHYLSSRDAQGTKQLNTVCDDLIQPQMSGIYARWRLNRFLFRWLGFCIKQGHVFKSQQSIYDTQKQILQKLKQT